MAICDLGYEHEDTAAAEPEPAVVVDQGPNENDVRIAEIEAEASIEREKIWTEQQELALAADNESLRGEIRGIRETLDRLVPPEPDPAADAPVVLEAPPAPAPAETGPPAPPESDQPPAKAKKSGGGGGWFDGYR